LKSVPEQADKSASCKVCGRTILKGELVHQYLTPQGQELTVCALCRSNAEASGWIPAALAGTVAQERPGRARRGQALRDRLGRAASRARTGARSGRGTATQREAAHQRERAAEEGHADAPPAKEPDEPAAEPKKPPPKPRAKRQPRQPAKKRQPAKQQGGQATPRKTRPRRGPDAIMRDAVDRFNSSDKPRKVAGLIRSLGEPNAAVTADPSRQMAMVTVAWELSWYQWEVGGNGEGDPVREVAKGDELSELAEEARTWNASVGEDGSLRLRSGARRAQPAKDA
jgi:hypothetical protein